MNSKTRCVRAGKPSSQDSARCSCPAYLTLVRRGTFWCLGSQKISPPNHNHNLGGAVPSHVIMKYKDVSAPALEDLMLLQQVDATVPMMKKFILLVSHISNQNTKNTSQHTNQHEPKHQLPPIIQTEIWGANLEHFNATKCGISSTQAINGAL